MFFKNLGSVVVDFLFIVTPILGVCNCSMFCYTLLYVHSISIAIILMGKRELVALLNLSSWCLVMVERLFLAVPRGCLWFVIVVFPDHTHLLFSTEQAKLRLRLRLDDSCLFFLGTILCSGELIPLPFIRKTVGINTAITNKVMSSAICVAASFKSLAPILSVPVTLLTSTLDKYFQTFSL